MEEDAQDEHRAPGLTWPDVPRLAFGHCHPGPVANIQWQREHGGMYGYVEGYVWAARTLYEQATGGGKAPESLIFPLAFLWRHHLELSLKWVIALGRRSDGGEFAYPAGHKLVSLWKQARPIIEPMGPPDSPELQNVAATLSELEKIDPYASGWRYPIDLQGVSSMKKVPDSVSLARFQEAMEAVSLFLECARTQLEAEAEPR